MKNFWREAIEKLNNTEDSEINCVMKIDGEFVYGTITPTKGSVSIAYGMHNHAEGKESFI